MLHINFLLLVNVSELMCPITSDASMQVCGRNNRTYPNYCDMLQRSSTQIRFRGACNRADCPDSPVSGCNNCRLHIFIPVNLMDV